MISKVRNSKLLAFLFAACGACALFPAVGCEGKAENAAEDVGEAIDDAADEVEDTIDDIDD